MRTILSVDVSSNNQPRTQEAVNGWVAQGCQLLWVHSYHRFESRGLVQSTRDWIGFARSAGLWCLPYVWLFRSPGDTQAQVDDALSTFVALDEDPKLMLLDCEDYEQNGVVLDRGPTANQVLIACERLRSAGVEPIVYSGDPWLRGMAGDHEILRGVPAIIANYDVPAMLNGFPAPDWVEVVGHQYTATPVDWSILNLDRLEALAGVNTAPPPPPAPNPALAELAKIREAVDALDGMLQ
jgi:hypothetical protein